MAIDRRTFLAMTGAGLLAPWVGAGAAIPSQPLWLSTGRDAENRYWLVAIDGQGELAYRQPLPGRAHGLAVSEDSRQAWVFARRPGDWAGPFNPVDGRFSPWISPPEGHIFVGHGCWLGENCWVSLGTESSEARLGCWSARTGGWITIIDLPGIGAHEVVALPNGEGMAVTIGGLGNSARTEEAPFSSALLLLNAQGEVRAKLPSPGPGFSVRHLSAAGRWVYVGLQYYGASHTAAPLVYRVSWRDPQWEALPAEPWQWLQMNNYIASVVAYEGGVTVSSPKGHHLMHWREDEPVRLEPMRDVAAISEGNGRLWAGNGLGQWREADLAGHSSRSGMVLLAFDNHGAIAWV